VDPARSALAKTEPRGSLETSAFSLGSPPISPNASVEAERGGGGGQRRLGARVAKVLKHLITLGKVLTFRRDHLVAWYGGCWIRI